jgi:hypothetical protein
MLLEELFCQESYAGADEERSDPAAAVHVLFEEQLCGCGCGDEGEGGRRGGYEAEVCSGEGKEEREEAQRHAGDADEEHAAGEDGFDRADEAGLCSDIVEVAEFAHAACDEDVASGGGKDNGGDGGPGMECGIHGTASTSTGACSVREGPLATKPTPMTMRATPSQREGDTCSWSQKRERTSTMTLPKAVAGRTKVMSAQLRAVM